MTAPQFFLPRGATAARVIGARRAAGLLLVTLKLALSLWILHLGFAQISDDDWARIVIAQRFAHAPHLDPSGTSWLPAPFWVSGTALFLFGRSIAVARALAVALGMLSVGTVFHALLRAGVALRVAAIATFIALATPMNAWLGVATVPEHWTGALIAVGAIGLAEEQPSLWVAALLFVAALSRYESWPVCAFYALVQVARALRPATKRKRRMLCVGAAAIAAIGPAAWIAWNAYAHGDPLHFFVRVASYRAKIEGPEQPLVEMLLYPRALAAAAPETVLFGIVSMLAMCAKPLRDRWALPLGATVAMLLFLVYGDMHNGAPTHHPERALVALTWVWSAVAIDALAWAFERYAWGYPKREMLAIGPAVALIVASAAYAATEYAKFPLSPADDRSAQLARGRALRDMGVQEMTITPCAYEHFALLASFGAPERAVVRPSQNRPVTPACPELTIPSVRDPRAHAAP